MNHRIPIQRTSEQLVRETRPKAPISPPTQTIHNSVLISWQSVATAIKRSGGAPPPSGVVSFVRCTWQRDIAGASSGAPPDALREFRVRGNVGREWRIDRASKGPPKPSPTTLADCRFRSMWCVCVCVGTKVTRHNAASRRVPCQQDARSLHTVCRMHPHVDADVGFFSRSFRGWFGHLAAGCWLLTKVNAYFNRKTPPSGRRPFAVWPRNGRSGFYGFCFGVATRSRLIFSWQRYAYRTQRPGGCRARPRRFCGRGFPPHGLSETPLLFIASCYRGALSLGTVN